MILAQRGTSIKEDAKKQEAYSLLRPSLTYTTKSQQNKQFTEMARVMIISAVLVLMVAYVVGQQQLDIMKQRPLDEPNLAPFQGGEGQIEGLQDPALEPADMSTEGPALTRKARTFGSLYINTYPRPYYYSHYPRYYSSYSTYYRPYYHRYYW